MSLKKALILIDIQPDFLPGGALAVPGGDEILEPVANLAEFFDTIVATQDWHPAGHKSFASSHGAAPFSTTEMPYGSQVLWPDHCVQGTKGADLALPAAALATTQLIIRKGTNPEIDSYSAFLENDRVTTTGLAGWLREKGVEELVLAGLALDYCVAFTALDAVQLGFDVSVCVDACRGIGEDSIREQMKAMAAAGVRFGSVDDVTIFARDRSPGRIVEF